MGFGVSFVQSPHHFTVHDPKQTGRILLGARKQQNFLRLRRKQEGLRPSIDQPKGTKPREIRTLGGRCKVKLRLQKSRQTADQAKEDQEDQGDQGREEEKVWCTLSESVDSMYI